MKMTHLLNIQPTRQSQERKPFTFGRIAVYGPADLKVKKAEALAAGHRVEVEPVPED